MRSPAEIILWLCCSIAACTSADHGALQSSVVDRMLNDPRYQWVTLETSSARIHFPVGSFADAHRDSLAITAEASVQTVLSRLDAADDARRFELFYVDTRHDMEQLTGNPVTGFSYYRDGAVVLVANGRWRSFERHELSHVVTLQTWGPAAGASSVEGLATFVDGECGGYENGRVARTMLERDVFFEMQTLVEEFRRQDDLIAYLQAAALFEFMYERLGTVVLRSLWSEGLQAAPGLLGVAPDQFEREFRDWLSSTYRSIPETAWQQIRSEGCGITPRLSNRGDR